MLHLTNDNRNTIASMLAHERSCKLNILCFQYKNRKITDYITEIKLKESTNVRLIDLNTLLS
jgi:hypothetical protein